MISGARAGWPRKEDRGSMQIMQNAPLVRERDREREKTREGDFLCFFSAHIERGCYKKRKRQTERERGRDRGMERERESTC